MWPLVLCRRLTSSRTSSPSLSVSHLSSLLLSFARRASSKWSACTAPKKIALLRFPEGELYAFIVAENSPLIVGWFWAPAKHRGESLKILPKVTFAGDEFFALFRLVRFCRQSVELSSGDWWVNFFRFRCGLFLVFHDCRLWFVCNSFKIEITLGKIKFSKGFFKKFLVFYFLTSWSVNETKSESFNPLLG